MLKTIVDKILHSFRQKPKDFADHKERKQFELEEEHKRFKRVHIHDFGSMSFLFIWLFLIF